MKILIVGVTGLAGTHLYEFLKNKESIDIYATLRQSSKNENIRGQFSRAKIFECDINNFSVLETVFNDIRPDIIFHFAAFVSVHRSFKDPLATFRANIAGTANLLEASKRVIPAAKILIPGSAEEYGKALQKEMPIREEHPLNPNNPYALSKKMQEDLALYYHRVDNLNVYLTRTFHYTGTGQPLGFVCSDFARQVVDVEQGRIKQIKVGNLDAKRDFSDIRDVVSAYWEIINKGNAGEIYNVCSSRSFSIRELLDRLVSFAGRDIPIEIDTKKLRPSDIPVFVGDNTKLKNLGWAQKYTIDETLKDVLRWWRKWANG
ncbi:MAG: GDP-mannose 4,6-dehydratase [Nitrospiraceae bacterium]|nr:GDP-mannose 4,6-dehydratase [Nitrospiraceae bacterium]